MNETRMVNRINNANDSISLWQLFKIIREHIILILVTTVILAGGSFAVAKYALIPQYTASSQILVNQKNATANGQAFTNQQADIQMINTYKELITNHQMLSVVQKKLANPSTDGQPAYQLSYKELKKMVKVRTIQNAQVFELKVTATSAKEASVIANAVADTFQRRIKKIMGFNNTKITSRAVVPSKPSFPNVELFALGGALVGFFLGTVIAVVKESH